VTACPHCFESFDTDASHLPPISLSSSVGGVHAAATAKPLNKP
jgi:hypothetical protein